MSRRRDTPEPTMQPAQPRRTSLWMPGWVARQFRPWRLGLSDADLRHRPLLSVLVAVTVWPVWAGWAVVVATMLFFWWMIAAVVAFYLLLSKGARRGGTEAAYWTAGKVADRI